LTWSFYFWFLIFFLGFFIKVFIVFIFIILIKFMFFSNNNNNENNNSNNYNNNNDDSFEFARNWVSFFFMYDISDLITRITGLKSLFDLSFSFNFYLIIFSRFYCSILVFLNKKKSFKFSLNLLNKSIYIKLVFI
jgi:hypothetical protein